MRIISRLKTSIRSLTIALVNALGVLVLSNILPGVEMRGIIPALIAVFLIGYLNSKIIPLINRVALPITVYTLGIGGLILNGLIIYFVAYLMPGFFIADTLHAVLFIFGVAIVNTIISTIFAIDDDTVYYRNVIKKQAKRFRTEEDLKTPGVVFLQIDGLAFNIFRRAIQSGNLPNISRWIREGKYRLEKWETDWQSQTGASQAGILMGSNKNIPAFRWYDKKLEKVIAFGNPKDLKYLEDKLSNGKGLLFNNGASRGNLFSGDADDTMLTVSSIGKKSKKGLGHGYYAYYSNPYNLPRTIVLFVIDVVKEIKSIIEQGRRDVWPRLTDHELIYPLLRASMTVVQRDVIIQTLIGDIYEGKDTVYADLTGYDEVSHHTGPERYETLAVLRDIDKQIARLMLAIEDSKKEYHLVILSDHGQTQGATFRQMTGIGLDEFVAESIGNKEGVVGELDNKESKNSFNNAVIEITKTGGIIGKSLKNVASSNKTGKKEKKTIVKPGIKVLASGALGLIYFTKFKKRLTLEEIDKHFPGLIDALVSNPLIGFVLVDSKKAGGIVIGPEGEYYLKTDKIVGKNPLVNFGENAAMHIKRTNTYPNVADIMVNSAYNPVMNEVYAFEEQVGSHGALGGDQMHPFVLFPSNWKYPGKTIISAENLHKQFKIWLKELGQKT